ncbi:MAG: toprim domain-containing protein [Bacteroidales bacterium]|nr:toprim domain-containing protein [Bacteroidales bacterium]
MALPDFRALKEKVGIDDIAQVLGYSLNKLAGVGRFIEMSLSDGRGNNVDTIVISNVHDKGRQMFFHRSSGKGGDVIELIRENINSFNVPYDANIYTRIGAVLCKYANEPLPEQAKKEYSAALSPQQPFEKERFEIREAKDRMFKIVPITNPRGLERDTLTTFSPHLVTILDKKAKFQFENLGFPYRKPGSEEIEGAEWRGQFGKKGKVAGTNSSSAAWIADFSSLHGSMPHAARNVFFFESGFDAMAFYQRNKAELDLASSVFVSLGGSFGERQVAGIANHYKGAKLWDCFDNDIAGRIFAIRMASIAEGKPVNYSLSEDKSSVTLSYGERQITMDAENASIGKLRDLMKIRREIGSWTAPAAFKDWNDCVLGVNFKESKEIKSKLQMYENLRNSRKM